ncbi:MAG: hypothetical protein WBO97_10850 [Tepidiformaceae bacterium]
MARFYDVRLRYDGFAMAFTVSDFQDLLALLKQNPEWLAELRELIVADDFRRIEAALERNAEEFQRTRLELLEELRKTRQAFDQRMQAFDERMQAFDQRLEAFDQRMQAFDERLTAIESMIARLVESQLRSEDRLTRLEDHSGRFMGFMVEERLRRNAPGYFGRHLSRAKVVLATDLPLVRAADDRGELADHEWKQLSALDIVVRGFAKNGDDSRHEVVLAIEASSVIDGDDVDRAFRRAEILKRTGYDARAWVGGASVTTEAEDLARRNGVQLLVSEALAQ